MLTKIILNQTMKIVEKQGHWGNTSKTEFIQGVQLAHEQGVLSEKTTFNLIMRANAI